MKRCLHIVGLCVLLALAFAGCGSQSSTSSSNSGPVTLNLAYFPNVTHAVALVGVARGTFQQELGSNVKLKTNIFNAGPAEIEALFAGDIDIGYVGPSPAINGFVQSHGQALRIIAGAASGGASLVVRPAANITSAKDLSGKKIADPQLGGTQDVSLRYYLKQNGLTPQDKGGNVQIVPTDNSTTLTLFKQGKIDAAWVPEPYATRLVVEDGGKLFIDERTLWPNEKFATTEVVVRTAFLNQHPDLVNKFLQADVDTVQYILSNSTSAQTYVNTELKQITGKSLSSKVIAQSFSNLDITYDPLTSAVQTAAEHAYALGFLKSSPDLNGIYYLGPLNQVLTSKGLATVAGS
jgi:NitT/TauT family transport system substrate-binding protein